MAGAATRKGDRWRRVGWPVGLFVAAVVVRLVWTLRIHPPSAYVFSDMLSYLARAKRLAGDWGGGPWADEPFFPWGTHYLLAGLMRVVGQSPVALGAAWGVLNAPIAPLAYLLAGRLHGGATWSQNEHGPNVSDESTEDEELAMTRAVARVAGLFMVVYYPALSYAGYFLSESPFMVLVTAAAWLALRLADHGRRGDAFGLGAVFALAFAVRPQILAAVGLLLVFFVWRRACFPRLGWRHGLIAVAPLGAMLLFSAQLSLRHTGLFTPLPHNGAVNRVFGRCHNYEMRAKDAMFGPPAFGALYRYELAHPDTWLKLAPAIDGKLAVKTRMADEPPLHALADRCVAESGMRRQAYYALTHVVLLWGYHVAWPDMAQTPFRRHMRGWTRAHLIVFVLPALLGMAWGSRREGARHGVLAVFLWSLLASVMLFMGAARFRVPYDVISVVLGLDAYGRAALWLTRWWQARAKSGPPPA